MIRSVAIALFITTVISVSAQTDTSAVAIGNRLPVYNLYYDADEFYIPASGYATLDSVVALMKADQNLKVIVTGYTDSTGSSGDNFTLSRRRAERVAEYIRGSGISASRVVVLYMGEIYAQKGENNSNRHVELILKMSSSPK